MRRALARSLLAATLGGVAMCPSPASAEDAREIALRGKQAVDGGDFATGCPLLAQAWSLDGSLLGAGFSLATCHERDGKLATAARLLRDVEAKARARGEARADEAAARAVELERRAPRLTLTVPSDVASAPGVVVRLAGQRVDPSAFGRSEPHDPGSLEAEVTATGRAPWTLRVEVPATGGEVALTAQLGAPLPPKQTTPPPAPPSEDGPPLLPIGLVAGGLGLAGIGASVLLGAIASGDYDAVEGCDDANRCTAEGAEARRDAIGLADVGTIVFVGGAVLTAAGGALVVIDLATSPEPTRAALHLEVGPTGAKLLGTF